MIHLSEQVTGWKLVTGSGQSQLEVWGCRVLSLSRVWRKKMEAGMELLSFQLCILVILLSAKSPWKTCGCSQQKNTLRHVAPSAGLQHLRLRHRCLSSSLYLLLSSSLLLSAFLFRPSERRLAPVSQNKDAKQRQIELLLGVPLVTTEALKVASVVCSLNDEAHDHKGEVTGCPEKTSEIEANSHHHTGAVVCVRVCACVLVCFKAHLAGNYLI